VLRKKSPYKAAEQKHAEMPVDHEVRGAANQRPTEGPHSQADMKSSERQQIGGDFEQELIQLQAK
jgi:hypothetical protein